MIVIANRPLLSPPIAGVSESLRERIIVNFQLRDLRNGSLI